MFMMSSGGLTAAELFAGKDAILSGPAGGVVAMAQTGRSAGLRRSHRLRHGGHLDRRRAFRRNLRTRVRDRSRGRAHARADDDDPHRRGRRRLDPAFRRRALSRRPGFGGRRSRPQMLSPRRPAGDHRRQRDDGQADPRLFSQDIRPLRRISRSMAEACAKRSRRWRAKSATGAAPRRSPTASSPLRSPRWPRRSRRYPSRAATTSRAMRSIASAAPAASTPATSPTRWRSRRC